MSSDNQNCSNCYLEDLLDDDGICFFLGCPHVIALKGLSLVKLGRKRILASDNKPFSLEFVGMKSEITHNDVNQLGLVHRNSQNN